MAEIEGELKSLLMKVKALWLSSVQFSRSVMSIFFRLHGLHHARLPCTSPTPGAYSYSCPLSWWCHPTISSSVVPFCSCLQSFPASGSFKWVSSSHQVAKILSFSFNISSSSEHPGLISFRIDGWISLQSKGLSSVFSNITVQKHQFFSAQMSL